jgi:hypothetical protein
MIVTAHIKFSLHTTFLDEMIQAEDERLPGESIEDGVIRVQEALWRAAERIKQKAYPNGREEWIPGFEFPPHMKTQITFEQPTIPVISKDTERLEIQIDNATTLEDLAKLKEQAGKQGLIHPYMQKMNELLNAPKEFTNGLE